MLLYKKALNGVSLLAFAPADSLQQQYYTHTHTHTQTPSPEPVEEISFTVFILKLSVPERLIAVSEAVKADSGETHWQSAHGSSVSEGLLK